VGDWVVNAKTFEATNDNQTVPLTARELALLQYFHQHPGVVLSRDDLLNRVWVSTTWARHGHWTSTSPNCAKKSKPIPLHRTSSRRYTGSVTGT
jgi:hypothetical protein